jgi:predicted P-loop ATPase/GTPase
MNGQCHFAEYKEGWNLLVSRVLPLPSGFSNVALRISKSYQYFLYRPSEAGNENYCYDIHARSGLRFATRLQEDA